MKLAPLLLVALTALVYRDSLWGVPRHDQLVYLYEASKFPGFLDLLAHSPAWNRSVSVGDHELFRPLLYVLLAVEHGLFGRRFALWQAAGGLLHAAQVVVVYRLLRRGFPAAPIRAFLGAGLFASLTLPAEAVIWHHINAYIVFTLCVTGSLVCLIDHLDSGGRRAAALAVLLAIAGAFTYEAGLIYCGIVGLGLAASSLRATGAPAEAAGTSVHARRTLAAVFLVIPVLYLAVSFADFVAHFGWPGRALFKMGGAVGPAHAVPYALYQLAFWLGGAVLPAFYDVAPGSRTTFHGFVWPGGLAALVNVAAAAAVTLGVVALAAARRRDVTAAHLGGVMLGLAFVLAHSLMVAIGRSVPRGLDYTLQVNLYYSYVAVLGLVVAAALGAWCGRRAHAGAAERAHPPLALLRAGRWLLVLGLGGLLIVNAASTMALLRDYRHLYAAPRLELLHHAARWHAAHERDAYYVVSGTCPGNEVLGWFAFYLRHDVAEPVRFLDTVYPGTSWILNQGQARPAHAKVLELGCDHGPVRPRALDGAWRTKIGPVRIDARDGGPITLTAPGGRRAGATLHRHLLAVPEWRLFGVVSHDEAYVFWSDSTVWWR